jgi:hypothetical protein
MDKGSHRLRQIYKKMSARERAQAVYRASMEGRPVDSALREMPPGQRAEFNSYIDLINMARSGPLSRYIRTMRLLTMMTDSKVEWWITLKTWLLGLQALEEFSEELVREPITQSEYKKLPPIKGYVSLAEAAVSVASEKHAWLRISGYIHPELASEDVRSDHIRSATAELLLAFGEGKIEGRWKGPKLLIRGASVDAWFGRPIIGRPEWGRGYDVRPDDQAERVQADLDIFRRFREALRRLPVQHTANVNLPVVADSFEGLVAGLEEVLRHQIRADYRCMRSAELIAQEIGERLFGEDPLPPVLRESLDSSRQTLEAGRHVLAAFGVDTELEEPSVDELEDLADLVGLPA